MTKRTDDAWDAAFAESQDGERLREAFAEEVERPGLEGPSYDAVLRSGTARLRRRRATLGATFTVVGVTGVAAAVLATGLGATHGTYTADAAIHPAAATTGAVTTTSAVHTTNSAPEAAAGTTRAARGSVPSTSSVADAGGAAAAGASSYPADAVLASGTFGGHAWQLVRRYRQSVALSLPGAPTPGSEAEWCGELDIVVDGVTTNSGNGNTPCLAPGPKAVPPPNPADPGFTSVSILDTHHEHLGAIVAGSVSPAIVSVTALCGSKSSTVKTSQPPGDVTAYYSFTFQSGSGCQAGSLSFFDASGSRTAFITDAALAGGK